MSADLLPVLRQKFFDNTGKPLAGGKLYSYAAGTTTPKATYSDQAGVTPNANPVILDSNGEAAIYINPEYYKFVLQDSNSVVQWTVDNATLPQVTALASAFYRDVVYISNTDSPYSIISTHNGKLIVIDNSSGAVTINLPQISTVTMPFNIALLAKTSSNTITINRAGTDTIFGATSKTLISSGTGTQLAADTDKSPNDWSTLDFGTVADGSITNAKLAASAISGMTEDTTPDPVADYYLTYDASATALKKALLSTVRDLNLKSKAFADNGYAILGTDSIIACDSSGGAFAMTLPAATSRRPIRFIKTTSDVTAITINRAGSDTIVFDGSTANTSVVLYTVNEEYLLVPDGTSKWYVAEHKTHTPLISSGAIGLTAVTANPNKGTTTTDNVSWYREGSNCFAIYRYAQGVGGTTGTGDYLYAIPSALVADTSILSAQTGTPSAISINAIATLPVVNGIYWVSSPGSGFFNAAYLYDSTHFRVNVDINSGARFGFWGSGVVPYSIASLNYMFTLKIPITGWKA